MNLEPVAIAAILDGGLTRLVSIAGGQLKVLLLRDGSEISGNGYSRGTITAFQSAVATAAGAYKQAAAPVAFTASGGPIIWDQFQVWNRSVTRLYATSELTADKTINAGARHNVTVRFDIATANEAPVGVTEATIFTADRIIDQATPLGAGWIKWLAAADERRIIVIQNTPLVAGVLPKELADPLLSTGLARIEIINCRNFATGKRLPDWQATIPGNIEPS